MTGFCFYKILFNQGCSMEDLIRITVGDLLDSMAEQYPANMK